MDIKSEMPLLARHAGNWVGRYTHTDANGVILDVHASRLTCAFPDSGPHPYIQTNRYLWDNGKSEEFFFPASYKEGRIWFDTDRIIGSAWEADANTVLLHWEYKSIPGSSLYEMIQLSPCGNHRCRTWHWFENNKIVKRTLITEQREVSK